MVLLVVLTMVTVAFVSIYVSSPVIKTLMVLLCLTPLFVFLYRVRMARR